MQPQIIPASQSPSPSPSSSSSPLPKGTFAPLFTLTGVDGDRFSLGDFRGKIVLLDFFATWCKPCEYEIPHLLEIARKYDDKVVIISVGSSSDTVEQLRQYKDGHQMIWRVARDTAGVFDKYEVKYIPTLVIIDQSGSVRYRNVGLTDASAISSEIERLLKG